MNDCNERCCGFCFFLLQVRQLFDEHLDQIVHIKSRLATRSEPCEFKQ